MLSTHQIMIGLKSKSLRLLDLKILNFLFYLQELRAALRVGGYILTAAISASIDTLAVGYDLPRVSENLDLVHMMAYDYHGGWEAFTAPNAPLYPPSDKLTLVSY